MIKFELKRLAAKGKKTFMATLAEKLRATLALTGKEEKKKKKVEERSKEKGKEQEKDKKNSQEKGKEQEKEEEKEMDVKVLSAAGKIIVVEDAVRVVKEHTSFKSLLGQCGVVKGLQKGGNVDIAFDNYKQHGLATKTLPALLVEHKGAPVHAQDLQTLVRKPRWIKKQLVQAAGVQDPSWSVLTTVEKGCQASEDQLDLFHTCVSWSLGLEGQKKIKVVPAMT